MDMGFVKFPFVRGRASCMFVRMYYYSVILQSHVTFLLVSPESGVPPYFNYLVSTHVNNTRSLYYRTLFPIPAVVLSGDC